MERWVGKVAVVTGASSGIGDAVVRDLVAHGLKVAALARRRDKLEKLQSDLSRSKGEIMIIVCDVTKDEDVIKAFTKVQKSWGAVHILVNNAGVMRRGATFSLPLEDVKAMFDTNVIGMYSCIREGLKLMKGIREGHIVNINSIAGHYHPPIFGFGTYSATKFGVTALTEGLRKEVAGMKESIRVTSISPGLTETEMVEDIPKGILTALPASAISQAVIYAISAPPVVNVAEMIIRPTGEQMMDLAKLVDEARNKE